MYRLAVGRFEDGLPVFERPRKSRVVRLSGAHRRFATTVGPPCSDSTPPKKMKAVETVAKNQANDTIAPTPTTANINAESTETKKQHKNKSVSKESRPPSDNRGNLQASSRPAFGEHIELVAPAVQGREGVDRVAAFQRRRLDTEAPPSNGPGGHGSPVADVFSRPIRSLRTVDQWDESTVEHDSVREKKQALQALKQREKEMRRRRGSHGEVSMHQVYAHVSLQLGANGHCVARFSLHCVLFVFL